MNDDKHYHECDCGSTNIFLCVSGGWLLVLFCRDCGREQIEGINYEI